MVASEVQRLEDLWANPAEVSASDVDWLSALAEENQAALPVWWLYLRAVQKAESPKFTQVLHRCAALSPNRDALMAWVEQPLTPLESKKVVPSPRSVSKTTTELPAEPAAVVEVKAESSPKAVPDSEPKIARPNVAKPTAPLNAPVASVPVQPPAARATNPTSINLDALPERVREQILRARAAREQLAKVGFGAGTEPGAGAKQPEPKSLEAPLPIAPAPTAGEQMPVEPTEATAPHKPKLKKPRSVEPVPEPVIQSEPQESKKVPASSTLSPFAQFVANLEGSQPAPKGEDLIDQFLAGNPKITPLAKDAPAPAVRTEPEENVTGLVTETLARMYAEQGHVAKAIQAYEILKLRVPEKSSIFAARIEALKTK